MTEEDLAVLANFAAVWQRVSGERVLLPAGGKLTWEEILQELQDYCHGCSQLAHFACGSHRKCLQRLATEAKGVFCRAQTEWFLQDGDLVYGVQEGIFASYTPYNLRKLYKSAAKLAERLQKAERDEGFPLDGAWAVIVRHGESLKELLQGCLQ